MATPGQGELRDPSIAVLNLGQLLGVKIIMGVHLFNFKSGRFVTSIDKEEVAHSTERQCKALDTLAASESPDPA